MPGKQFDIGQLEHLLYSKNENYYNLNNLYNLNFDNFLIIEILVLKHY